MGRSNESNSAISRKRVVYALVKDVRYPRNSRIRESLSKDFDVVTTPGLGLDTSYPFRLFRAFYDAYKKHPAEIVILSELNLQLFPAVWLAARLRRSVLVVDWFVGLYETNILDWREDAESSFKAKLYQLLDHLSVRFADIVVTDTDVRADRLRPHAGKATVVLTLPVGSPAWIQSAKRPEFGPTVLFYGDYLPLHGVDLILGAAAEPEWPENATLVLVGSSPNRTKYERIADDLGIRHRCHFADHMSTDELSAAISKANVILGIFGDSPKARSVIPNKVWQGLSAGRVVVTRSSEAYSEIRRYTGGLLVEVTPQRNEIALAVSRAMDMRAPDDTTVRDQLELYVSRRFAEFTTILKNT